MALSKEAYIDFGENKTQKPVNFFIIDIPHNQHKPDIAFEQLQILEGATPLDSALLYDSKQKSHGKIILIKTTESLETAVRHLHPEVFKSGSKV